MTSYVSNLAYIRLVPMDDAALQRWQEQQPTPQSKRLIANYDAGNIDQWGVHRHEDFDAEFECLRDTDFEIVLYAMTKGPITLYPSKIGEPAADPSAHGGAPELTIHRVIDQYLGRGYWAHQCATGVDPLAEAIRAAHGLGVKLFPQIRLNGPQISPCHLREHYGGRIMAEHPEWMSTYPDGEPTRHLSFAFKPVRDFYVALMREWVKDYRADGVNVLFSRSQPFVYYEQPVCDVFQEKFGEDARSLTVDDVRLQQIRSTFVTEFLRETRDMLNEVGQTQGRNIPNCYLVPINNSPSNISEAASQSSLAEFMFNALDVKTWIVEGIVDYLVLHLHVYKEHDGKEFQSAIREVTDLAKGTNTKVYVDIYPRRLPPRVNRNIAINYYEAGADGLAFWDSYNRYYRASEWAMLKRLGHKEQLAQWQGMGDDHYRVIPLKRLDGFITGREFSRPTDG